MQYSVKKHTTVIRYKYDKDSNSGINIGNEKLIKINVSLTIYDLRVIIIIIIIIITKIITMIIII